MDVPILPAVPSVLFSVEIIVVRILGVVGGIRGLRRVSLDRSFRYGFITRWKEWLNLPSRSLHHRNHQSAGYTLGLGLEEGSPSFGVRLAFEWPDSVGQKAEMRQG